MNHRIPPFALQALSVSLAFLAQPACAAPTVYEMRLATNGGMGAGAMGGLMSMISSGGSSVNRNMDLRLMSPTDLPSGYQANHIVPEGMRIGPQLPLQGERHAGGSTSQDSDPDGRILIYWGCSATVPKGQPEVIDFRAMAGKLPPEIQAMARQGRSKSRAPATDASLPPRTITWPSGDRDYRGIPENATAVGDHSVKTNFMTEEIRFNVTPALDFLEPMNLKAQGSDLKTAIPLRWAALSRARGYDLQAVSANGEKDVVLWLAARSKSPMLPASQHDCTIPEGIFAKSEMAMLTGIAHGPVQGFSYPPQKPGEKKPLIWTATVTVTAYDSVLLGMEAAAAGAGAGGSAGAAQDAAMPGVGSLLKGIFGR